jgi:hypothetical protein
VDAVCSTAPPSLANSNVVSWYGFFYPHTTIQLPGGRRVRVELQSNFSLAGVVEYKWYDKILAEYRITTVMPSPAPPQQPAQQDPEPRRAWPGPEEGRSEAPTSTDVPWSGNPTVIEVRAADGNRSATHRHGHHHGQQPVASPHRAQHHVTFDFSDADSESSVSSHSDRGRRRGGHDAKYSRAHQEPLPEKQKKDRSKPAHSKAKAKVKVKGVHGKDKRGKEKETKKHQGLESSLDRVKRSHQKVKGWNDGYDGWQSA